MRGSKRLETIQVLGLRPCAFICLSVCGTPDEALALVFDISLQLRNACLQHAVTQQRGKDIFVAKLN